MRVRGRGRGRGREKEEGNEANLGSPFWAKSRGYSAFQYTLPDLTPKTNRCASRFATTASAFRASTAVRGPKARLFSAAFCSPHWAHPDTPTSTLTLKLRHFSARRGASTLWGDRKRRPILWSPNEGFSGEENPPGNLENVPKKARRRRRRRPCPPQAFAGEFFLSGPVGRSNLRVPGPPACNRRPRPGSGRVAHWQWGRLDPASHWN